MTEILGCTVYLLGPRSCGGHRYCQQKRAGKKLKKQYNQSAFSSTGFAYLHDLVNNACVGTMYMVHKVNYTVDMY